MEYRASTNSHQVDADKKASRCEAGGGGYAHEWAASQYVPDVAVK